MIKTTPHKIVILMGILLSPSVFATDINVEFTATVKATTCNITLTGNNVTNDGNNNYTLRIGNDSNLLIVFYVQIMPDDFVMQLHRF
ncbi:hypothetical protein L476_00137 [Escherichia coli BIDMC 39]|nr:hypothetical protein L476_00137 [Escherichia coli BIDMC 39]